MTGRPTKCTEKRTATIADALAEGYSIDASARAGNISPRSYHVWIERGEAEEARLDDEDAKPLASEAPFLRFLQETARALATYEAELVGDLKRVARGYELQTTHRGNGETIYSTAIDWRAAAWLLERKFPERYGSRAKVEHSGGVSSSLAIQLPEGAGEAAIEFVKRLGDSSDGKAA